MVKLDQCYKRNDNFVFRKIENETILVPIKDNVGDMGCIYNLNKVGAFIWEQFDGEKTLRDIKQDMLDQFDVPSEEAEIDLSEFVEHLKEIDAILQVETK